MRISGLRIIWSLAYIYQQTLPDRKLRIACNGRVGSKPLRLKVSGPEGQWGKWWSSLLLPETAPVLGSAALFATSEW